MNLPLATIQAIIQTVQTTRPELEQAILKNVVSYSKLMKLQWRVDIIISSGVLSRVMRPSVLLQVS